MKMTKISVELDNEQFDKLVVEELIRTRQTFLNDLGANNHVFVWGDQEADDAEIQKHIDSVEQLIKWFGTPEQVKRCLAMKTDDIKQKAIEAIPYVAVFGIAALAAYGLTKLIQTTKEFDFPLDFGYDEYLDKIIDEQGK